MPDLMTALRNADAAGDTEAATRIAAMIKSQNQPDQSLGDQALGVAENIGSIVSGAIAEPVAGIAGIAQSINPFAEEGAGAEAVSSTREALTYQPRTEAGKEQQQAIGEALQPIGEAISSAETVLGESTLDMTGSPFLASIAHSLPTAALEVLGFKGSKKITGAPKAPTTKQVQKAVVESAPEIAQIKKASNAIYREIDDSGVTVKPEKVSSLVNRISTKTRKAGIDADVTPKAAGALNRFNKELGEAKNISDIDTLRKVAQGVAGQLDNTEKALGNIMISEIDDFLDNLNPSDLTVPSKKGADVGKKFKAARKLWGRARRSEMIQEAIEQGGNAASGAENGIRVKLRSIANNKKKSKFFSKKELDAINDVVKGDFKTNIAKLVGRFGFSEGGATNVLSSLAGSFGGASVFGPAGAIAVPAAGQASRVVAQKLTKNKAKFTDAIVRAGNDANEITKAYLTIVPKSKRSVQDLSDLLSDPNLNLEELKLISNETVKDAIEVAKGKRAINMSASALAGTAREKEQQQQ